MHKKKKELETQRLSQTLFAADGEENTATKKPGHKPRSNF
jgi:hypothetical protein